MQQTATCNTAASAAGMVSDSVDWYEKNDRLLIEMQREVALLSHPHIRV